MSYVVRGHDYLNRHPDFRLIARDAELKELASILMRKTSNSVLLVGPAGVGSSALCLGLQAMKHNPDAPFDIVSKRFYWLETDGLFSSGDPAQINAVFQRMIAQLWGEPNDVLIIKDTRVFIEASQRSGCGHFMNALTNASRNDKVQIILEVRDDDLDYVMKAHTDIRESYTLMDVQEPRPEALKAIVDRVCEGLAAHHGVRISEDARNAAIELTQKYRTEHLREAQPARAITLLDRALAIYRLDAHSSPPHLAALRTRASKAPEAERTGLDAQLREATAAWAALQDKVRKLYLELRHGEIAIQEHEVEIERLQRQERERAQRRNGGETPEDERPAGFRGAASFMAAGGVESPAIAELRRKIAFLQGEVTKLRHQFATLTADINKDLELDRAAVTAEFSAISGIDAAKLNEDEIEILRNLESTLKARVFGQDHVLAQVANGIKVAKVGGLNGDKPLASYMFIGPSGVGKTEVAKAVTQALKGDEKVLLRFDMGEYMEKHAVAKLIGAPPGYEGFEVGGILTNAMRKNRNRVILFDEIEKAHPDVFNVLLQVLDDGRLTDNIGRVADFSDAIIIMTSNIGQPFFLDKDLDWEEAKRLAAIELERTYRSEFLNRFNGRQNIICFNRLGLPEIERIVRREVAKIDAAYAPRGLATILDDKHLQAFCSEHYDPKTGARGLPGMIKTRLEPIIVNTILERPRSTGVFHVGYDAGARDFVFRFEERPAGLAASAA
jgi:ATP-dependent Clp protease ATP-binding subunit ClpB